MKMLLKICAFSILLIYLNLMLCGLTATPINEDSDISEFDEERTEYDVSLEISYTKTHFREGEEVSLTCTCEAFPNCEIMWTYYVLSNQSYSKTLQSYTSEEKYNTRIEKLRFNAEESCKIVCQGINPITHGQNQKYATSYVNIFVSDLSESIEVSKKPDTNVLIEGDDFEMTCSADATFYRDVIWYRNGKWVRSYPGLQQSLITTKLSMRNVLKFDGIRESESGHYECRVTGKDDLNKNDQKVFYPYGKSEFIEVRNSNDKRPNLRRSSDVSETVSDNESDQNEFSISIVVLVAIVGVNVAILIIVLIVIVLCFKKCFKRETPQHQGYEMKSLTDNEERTSDEQLKQRNTVENEETSSRLGNLHPDLIPSCFYKKLNNQDIQLEESTKVVYDPVAECNSTAEELISLGVPSEPGTRTGFYSKDGGYQPLLLALKDVATKINELEKQENERDTYEIPQNQIRRVQPKPMEASYIRRSAVIVQRRTTNSQLLKEADEFYAICDYYDFSADDLELGKNLGMGAFGVVRHAYAHGLVNGEEKTPVAVKSVRGEHKHEKQALMSEIKIMVHIGQHKNVVNLLGIISEDTPSYNFMIMVEYCSLGNVRDYLQCNRKEFIDEIDPVTGLINSSLRESALKSHNSLTTSHLLSWSFQVARGMEFLSSKRVIHGDLAARNILLCEDNFVKICDFGLARFKRESNYYRKRGSGLLPVKWIALECFNDNIFSTYSDVWSFGVVLWEFYSLGEEPYPETDLSRIFAMLSCGNRMPKPKYSTEDLYDVMRLCWSENPKDRPLFSDLEDILGKMLDSRVKNFVVSSNAPYVNMNKKVEDYQRNITYADLEKIKGQYQDS